MASDSQILRYILSYILRTLCTVIGFEQNGREEETKETKRERKRGV